MAAFVATICALGTLYALGTLILALGTLHRPIFGCAQHLVSSFFLCFEKSTKFSSELQTKREVSEEYSIPQGEFLRLCSHLRVRFQFAKPPSYLLPSRLRFHTVRAGMQRRMRTMQRVKHAARRPLGHLVLSHLSHVCHNKLKGCEYHCKEMLGMRVTG